MLRLSPICFLLTSCSLLETPTRIVQQAGSATVDATKRAASATQKFGRSISDKYFTKNKKRPEEPTAASTNKIFAELPQPDPYTPAPVRPTVFIPDRLSPTADPPIPKVPAATPLPGKIDLPDLPDLPNLPDLPDLPE